MPTTFHQSNPLDPTLLPYIATYVSFCHPTAGKGVYKNILPCPGISVIFNFRKMFLNGSISPDVVLIGLHEQIYQVEPQTDEINTIIVRFTPTGCHSFINVPVSDLSQQTVDASRVLGPGIFDLFAEMVVAADFQACVALLDHYFVQRLKESDPAWSSITAISEKIKEEPEPTSFDLLAKEMTLPYSSRHMARKFKEIVGVNLQTFIKICRFEKAKEMFLRKEELSLTDIGYRAGYYDQAHFSKEFKQLSGLNAKLFFPHCALQQVSKQKGL